MADILTISDLHRRTGKPSSALRFYEREHLLAPVGREGGMRVYAEAAVNQVALIDLLQLAGFTLGEIRGIVSPDGAFSSDWRIRAMEKIDELNRHLARIELAKMILEHTVTCPHDSLNECTVFTRGVADHAATLRVTEQHDVAAG